MSSLRSYGSFAEYYDKLTSNISYPKRGEYFNEILKRNSIRGGILVDLACGTGSLSEVMAGFGFDVIGVDGSAEMLTIAMNKRFDSNKDILYLNQKMQELDLYGTIDVCICALDSLNHIVNEKALQCVFDKVAMFLNPGAVFIFDVNTPYKHTNILSNNTFIYDYDEVYCVWQNSECHDDIIDISLDLFCKNKDDSYNKFSEGFSERAYSHERILEFLKRARLTLVDYYAEDSFDKPKEDCQRIIYVTKSQKLNI